MSNNFVSRFTPSLMTPETLEALFIQREKLAEELLCEIEHSARSRAKHHSLLIAPRGLGKTHLVSIVYNRVIARDDLAERLRIAWLREEERGVTSFLELLMRILMALARQYSDDALNTRIQALYDLSRKEGEYAAADLLTEYIGKRTLLLIVENLDSIFSGLRAAGAQALRAYLQEHPICTILATATSLFNGVSFQTSAFYGFFHIHHLEEVSLEDAVSLLARIAEVKGDGELASFIRTPVGRARIRAVRHLAGGNHRVYVVFSEFLTRSSLDELVNPFMRMLDDLTPYYQGRMDLLSPQQQQIVEYMAHSKGAQTVRDIAKHSFTSQQTAANQLKDLKGQGYLLDTTPQADRRETYYELREPLMRLCFEVKEYRGGPIRLFVDFLRNWHSRDELRHRLDSLPLEADMERSCLVAAIEQVEKDSDDPRISACVEAWGKCKENSDYSGMLQVAEELAHVGDDKYFWCAYGFCLLAHGRHGEALQAFDRALELDNGFQSALVGRGCSLVQQGAYQEALSALDQAGEPPDEAHMYWCSRARAQFGLAHYEESLASIDRLIMVDHRDNAAWLWRGKCLAQMERYEDALESFQKASSLAPNLAQPLAEQAQVLLGLHRVDEALAVVDRGLNANPSSADLLIIHGALLLVFGRYPEGIASVGKALTTSKNSPAAWVLLGELLMRNLQLDEALKAFEKALVLEYADVAKLLVSIPVDSIKFINSPTMPSAPRKRWLEEWQGLVEGKVEFEQSLRMLEAAVTYLNTGDDRALLSLPLEMREIVKKELAE